MASSTGMIFLRTWVVLMGAGWRGKPTAKPSPSATVTHERQDRVKLASVGSVRPDMIARAAHDTHQRVACAPGPGPRRGARGGEGPGAGAVHAHRDRARAHRRR